MRAPLTKTLPMHTPKASGQQSENQKLSTCRHDFRACEISKSPGRVCRRWNENKELSFCWSFFAVHFKRLRNHQVQLVTCLKNKKANYIETDLIRAIINMLQACYKPLRSTSKHLQKILDEKEQWSELQELQQMRESKTLRLLATLKLISL
jgi:hypothetical protein